MTRKSNTRLLREKMRDPKTYELPKGLDPFRKDENGDYWMGDKKVNISYHPVEGSDSKYNSKGELKD